MTVIMKARREARSPTKVALNSSEPALQKLLQHPIRFVTATSLTSNDEAKTAPNRSITIERRTENLVQPLHHSEVCPRYRSYLFGLNYLADK